MESIYPCRPLRIFTWHVHGTYLYYLSKGNFELFIPVTRQSEGKRSFGYYGRGRTFPFGPNVIEVDPDEMAEMDFDCILFQDAKQFLEDQWEILTPQQRKLPRIFLEHNAPEPHPANSIHPVIDPEVVLVHVTHFNKLMWDNQVPDVRLIEHGIPPTATSYNGGIPEGLVVINHLFERGRKLGADIVQHLQSQVPLRWIGMGDPVHGGLGEVLHPQLPAFSSRYRFVFNPIRHTSLALSVLEAMMIGIPVVSLATTEYASLIKDGLNGFCSNDLTYLSNVMKRLIDDPHLSREIGQRGKETALAHYNINRFVAEWQDLFEECVARNRSIPPRDKKPVYQ